MQVTRPPDGEARQKAQAFAVDTLKKLGKSVAKDGLGFGENSAEMSERFLSVLIVGSGPAGLFAASELVRHGVKPRIVEQRLEPHHEIAPA